MEFGEEMPGQPLEQKEINHLLERRPRGPRFAIIILIMFAIMSLILAITVAYIIF
jgi:hypothetical protein